MANKIKKYVNTEVNVVKLMRQSNIYVRLEKGKDPMIVKKRFTEGVDIKYEMSQYNNIIIDDGKEIEIYCEREEYMVYKEIIENIRPDNTEIRQEIKIYIY